jgi:hypothetical protein
MSSQATTPSRNAPVCHDVLEFKSEPAKMHLCNYTQKTSYNRLVVGWLAVIHSHTGMQLELHSCTRAHETLTGLLHT